MIASPPATTAYIIQPAPTKSGNCAMKMRIARAFTNPIITGRGTNFMYRPSFSTPNRIWIAPVSSVAARR